MDRAFLSGAAGSAPAAPASPSIGYPTAGNPATGTQPTKPGPWWYHMITEELRGLIAAAGLTPSQTDLTQLLQALPAALASRPEMARSLSLSGYQKLPGGLLVQWGTMSINSGWTGPNVATGTSVNQYSAAASWTFPVAFPNACLSVAGAPAANGGGTFGAASFYASSMAAASVSGVAIVHNNPSSSLSFRMLAAGY